LREPEPGGGAAEPELDDIVPEPELGEPEPELSEPEPELELDEPEPELGSEFTRLVRRCPAGQQN
jgi:hypothetical protein